MSEDKLPIFFAEACHHEAEDMEESPNKQYVSRPVIVIKKTDDGAREKHDEDL